MVSIVIDDFEFKVKPQISILEACKIVGINIPRFCYHEILSVAGNCRMCLVEVDGIDKPVASCVTEINEGIAVYTNTPFVKKARENVVEALLLNHPLDCPICDQAGECDLQDQTKAFGSVNSRYFFNKKGTEDKYCGPLIKTIMTRCITCTRCVRYSTEITGVDFFGTLNRGGSTEIGPYVPHFFNSEISGNVIDLCPVGALTSKPYAFKARPWELRLTETIDTTNAEGIHIYVNHKETEIFRILPRSNKNINSNLISDKTRFTYDANGVNRILHPFVKNTSSGKYIKKDWKRFFLNCDYRINLSNPTTIYIDGNCDFESAVSIKELEYLTKNKVKVHNIDFMNYENIYVKNQYNVLNTVKSI
jgi:NADH-quinone oxidoreductase chain G